MKSPVGWAGRLRRREPPPITVAPGERLLAWARAVDGALVGATRDALYLSSPEETRIPWQLVEAAEWDRDTSTLRVAEVGTWGAPRPEHRLRIDEPGRLLELLRERVTSTIVLQRHVAVRGRAGLRVIARRAPGGAREITWLFEYDAGVDPDDPAVREAADEALAAARDEVGPA